MLANEYIKEGFPIEGVLKILELSRSSYYYKTDKKVKPKGRPKSCFTIQGIDTIVPNDMVVKDIIQILNKEFVDYGYRKMTYALRQMYEYQINCKKVYRLMAENALINQKHKVNRSKRRWVKDLVPKPEMDLSYFEVDIKSIYIQGSRKNALLISVIDVSSRWLIAQYFGWNIRKKDVVKLFNKLFESYELPNRVFVRNDNGSQFIANYVQMYFEEKSVTQEFIRPATPEQNAHIESYHSILEKVICQKYEFQNLSDAQKTMNRFVVFYNFERIHSGINYLSPYNYLLLKGIDMKANPSILRALDCNVA